MSALVSTSCLAGNIKPAQMTESVSINTPFSLFRNLHSNRDDDTVAELESLLPDPKGPNAIKPPVPEKLQVEQMKSQIKQADQQLQMKLGVLKLMDTAKLNEAKIHKLEAEALLALEEAGGVRTGQEIQLINSQIAAIKAKNEGIMSSIELMMKLTEGEDKQSEPTGE